MYTIGHTDRIIEQDYLTTITSISSGKIDSLQRTRAVSAEQGLRNVVNLDYEWDIDTSGKKLSFGFEYFTRPSNRERGATNQSFISDGVGISAPASNLATGDLDVQYKELKADMIFP